MLSRQEGSGIGDMSRFHTTYVVLNKRTNEIKDMSWKTLQDHGVEDRIILMIVSRDYDGFITRIGQHLPIANGGVAVQEIYRDGVFGFPGYVESEQINPREEYVEKLRGLKV